VTRRPPTAEELAADTARRASAAADAERMINEGIRLARVYAAGGYGADNTRHPSLRLISSCFRNARELNERAVGKSTRKRRRFG
jgi:hypothetical protein